MYIRISIIASLLAISSLVFCQSESEINKTDQSGLKQGHWIKKYPDNSVMYDGFFKNDHPVGAFKRYYENNTIKSILRYSEDGKEAIATFYHPNGYVSSRGTFINQMKEGKWQFFSEFTKDYLVSEENYNGNLKNGLSLKFYPDSTVAERVIYKNNIKEGEWIQYYPNKAVCLKSYYQNGKVNGRYEVWFDNGQIQFSGQYKNDVREGLWLIYLKDGTLKYKIEYLSGVTKDRQLDIDESNYLDSLDRNKGKIADPEKTGVMW